MTSSIPLVALCVLSYCLLIHSAAAYPLPTSEDDDASLIPLEQHIVLENLRYKQWRQAVQRGESFDGTVDWELLEHRDDPVLFRSRGQEQQWRRQQRAEALYSQGPYDRSFTAREHDLLPLHHGSLTQESHSQQQRQGERNRLLELPSTDVESNTLLALTEQHVSGPRAEVQVPKGVKPLRRFLAERDADCDNCVELHDLVERATAVRVLPTHEDLAVAELSGTPQFTPVGKLTNRAEELEELLAMLDQQNPQAAESVRLAVAQRAMLRAFSYCRDPNVDWLGEYNSTIPAGCTLSGVAM